MLWPYYDLSCWSYSLNVNTIVTIACEDIIAASAGYFEIRQQLIVERFYHNIEEIRETAIGVY